MKPINLLKKNESWWIQGIYIIMLKCNGLGDMINSNYTMLNSIPTLFQKRLIVTYKIIMYGNIRASNTLQQLANIKEEYTQYLVNI